MMCLDDAMDTLEVLVVGDHLEQRDVEAIQVVLEQVPIGQAVEAAEFALETVDEAKGRSKE